MGRQKKEYRQLSLKIDAKIYERLEKYCEESGQTKTFAVEKGLTLLMDEYAEMMKKIAELKAR